MSLKINKLLDLQALSERRKALRSMGKRLVLTNGCFDLLHVGHVYSLEAALTYGDVLWVGVNSDRSVRLLKGAQRPIYPQEARLYLLNTLACVGGLFLFDGGDCADAIATIQPDVYVKSGHYSPETLHPAERLALEQCHALLVFVPGLPDWSTTHTIQTIQQRYSQGE